MRSSPYMIPPLLTPKPYTRSFLKKAYGGTWPLSSKPTWPLARSSATNTQPDGYKGKRAPVKLQTL